MGFTRSSSLYSHERTHMEEKPFTCSRCDKSFKRHGDLKRHEKTHKAEKAQSLSKDPLEIKEEHSTDPVEMEPQCSSWDTQDSANDTGFQIENEVFYQDIKQEPM